MFWDVLKERPSAGDRAHPGGAGGPRWAGLEALEPRLLLSGTYELYTDSTAAADCILRLDAETAANWPAAGQPAPQYHDGDANGDEKVNVFDLAILANHYGLPGDWDREHGDFDDDDSVGVLDLAILANNYGWEAASPNTPPTADDGSFTVAPNGSHSGSVTASDVDAGDTLAYSVVDSPAHGTLTSFDAATGAFSYVPADDYDGLDSFSFRAHDGTVYGNTATVSITVTDTGWPSWMDPALPDFGIQDDLDALFASGGGTLTLPAGTIGLSTYLYLPSGVTLQGQGSSTVLSLAEQEQRRDVVSASAGSSRITVTGDITALTPGALVTVWRMSPISWLGYLRHLTVDHVDGQDIVFTQPYAFTLNPANNPYVSWGKTTRLNVAAAQGGTTIRVDHPELFRPGQAITYHGSGDPWDEHFNVITAISGDELTLRRPAAGAAAGTLVYQGHSMITSHGESGVSVEALVIRGWPEHYQAAWEGFYRGGIHTYNVAGVTVRNLEVRNWYTDGVSIQGGSNALVTNIVSSDNKGHGFHPGTGLTDAEWTDLQGYDNMADGLYYCWHNNNVNVRNSTFSGNGRHGIGGLGNPGDRNNTVEGNTIEGNAQAGVFINGGLDAYNTIRNNTIRDNSRSSAGQYAGIHFGSTEAARQYTIDSNTITGSATQRVGIQEHSSSDYNTIRGNTFSGHATADAIIYGDHTTVDEPGDNIVYYLTFDGPAGLGAPVGGVLTAAPASGLLDVARSYWGAPVAAPAELRIVVADLGGKLLGAFSNGTIYVDDDAAGYGWFVDETPLDDVEFAPDAAAAGRVDLLSAVAHEIGHALGYGHSHTPGDVMAPALALGVRTVDVLAAAEVEVELQVL